MRLDEEVYFGFVTWAILALELGLLLFNRQKTEHHVFANMSANKAYYEKIGVRLIWIGYIFFLIDLLPISVGFAFIILTFSFLRFIGLFYLLVSSSKQTLKYALIVFVPFILIILKEAIFIELLVVGFSALTLLFLKKKISPILTVIVLSVALFGAIILQAVKHQYRDMVWKGEKVSLIGMMFDQQSRMNSEEFKRVGAIFNIRINQGWIVGDVINHSSNEELPFDGKYAKDEAIGILLPRFLYPDKPIVGSHDKFDYFVGWHLADGTAMNLGLIGDAYGNFGPKKGIIFIFIFGCIIGFGHRRFQKGLLKYPDLLCWTPLFYNYLIRAGNEFYIITNWYVKTGLITLLFFYFVRKHLADSSLKIQSASPSTSAIPQA